MKNLCLVLCLFFIGCFSSYAEGSKDLMADTSSRAALSTVTGLFAGNNSSTSAFRRLNIHIGNPATETIYFGFSRGYSTGFSQILGEGSTSTPTYYFRLINPAGVVVYGPQAIDASNAIPAGIAGFNQVKAGPAAIVGSSGFTAFNYMPLVAGDYYIQFNKDADFSLSNLSQCSFDYWDITVANTTATTPVAIPGRIWAELWGFYSKDYVAPGGGALGYSGIFKGLFYSYTPQGYVEKINFNPADFRSGSFTMGMNNAGPGTSGNYIEDRKSRYNQNVVGTEYKLFLNNPDINEYPTGNATTPLFTMQDPTLACGASTLDINYYISRTATVQIILDFDSNGVYDLNTRDRVLGKRTGPGNQTITWDLKDGLGNTVDSLTLLKVRLVSVMQLDVHHISFDDLEIMSHGFTVEQVRPIFKAGLENKFYWDDTDIFNSPGSTDLKVPYKTGPQPNVVELIGAPVRKWDNFSDNNIIGFGNKNSINTWWSILDIPSSNRIKVAACTTLPLSLLSFSLSGNDNKVQLQWQTTNESQLSKFVVERSTDAVNFTYIGELPATNTIGTKRYGFADIYTGSAVKIFYRLRIMNVDGGLTYSDLRDYKLDRSRFSMQVSPNPFTDKLTISVPATWNNATVKVILLSANGAVALEKNMQVQGGQMTLSNLSIAPGLYFVNVLNGKEKLISKSMKF